MPIGVVVASMNGKVLHRNAVAAELVGARAGQPVVPGGSEPWMLAPLAPEHSARFQAVFASASAGQPGHCMIPSPFDARRWLRVSASPAAASTVVMTIEDMTELAEAERALPRLEPPARGARLALRGAGGGVRRRRAGALHQLVGAPAPRAATRVVEHSNDFIEYVHLADRAVVIDLERRVRANPSSSGAVEFRVDVDDDPAGRWHHATMTNLLDDPDVQGLVLTLRDVHERHLIERELRFWATHDALTSLPDRAALRTQLDAVLDESDVFGHRTALVFCDVDNFKLINDESRPPLRRPRAHRGGAASPRLAARHRLRRPLRR